MPLEDIDELSAFGVKFERLGRLVVVVVVVSRFVVQCPLFLIDVLPQWSLVVVVETRDVMGSGEP
jgi:hypothetical protein